MWNYSPYLTDFWKGLEFYNGQRKKLIGWDVAQGKNMKQDIFTTEKLNISDTYIGTKL